MAVCRPKPIACGSDSSEERVSPTSPKSSPAATRSSPPGLNDMELEVANELRAMQRGVLSATGRQPVASSPLREIPASRVGYERSRPEGVKSRAIMPSGTFATECG